MKRIVFGLTLGVILTCMVGSVTARDLDGRYANSPLKSWFDRLASGKGLCCSMADGESVADPDWESKDGHYRVRLENSWIDVPDDALITEPNRAGRTMVWPMRFGDQGVVGNIDPVVFKADSIVAVFGFPIRICDAFT